MLDIFKYGKTFSRDINILWLVHRTLRDDFPKVDVKAINYDFGRRSGRSERIAWGQSPKARSRLFLLRRLKNFVGSIRTSSFDFEKKPERKKIELSSSRFKIHREEKKILFRNEKRLNINSKLIFELEFFFRLRFALCQSWGKEAENMICCYWNDNIQLVWGSYLQRITRIKWSGELSLVSHKN